MQLRRDPYSRDTYNDKPVYRISGLWGDVAKKIDRCMLAGMKCVPGTDKTFFINGKKHRRAAMYGNVNPARINI